MAVTIDGTANTITAKATSLITTLGTAPSYSTRAWVNFNGTGAVAIRAGGNVSSITDNGTGDYTANFTTAMADANFNVQFGSDLFTVSAYSSGTMGGVIRELAAGYVRFYIVATNGGGNNTAFYPIDQAIVTLSVIR